MSINRVLITGNLTRDPQLRMTTNGTRVMNFGVAVNDRRRNQQTGEWEDFPNFIDCVLFGQRAESLARFLSKGTKVAIEGKLRYSTWETQEGQRRSKIEVVVDDLDFISRRNDGQGRGGYSNPQSFQGGGQGYSGGQSFGGGNRGYGSEGSGGYGSAPSYSVPAPVGTDIDDGMSNGSSPAAPMPPEGTVYDEDIPF